MHLDLVPITQGTRLMNLILPRVISLSPLANALLLLQDASKTVGKASKLEGYFL